MQPPLVQLRRRDFLHLGAGLAAMTCGGELDEPTSSTDTGDDTTGAPDDTTAGSPTTGAPDDTTSGEASTTAGTTTGADACTPTGSDTGLTVSGLAVGACQKTVTIEDTYVVRDELGIYALANKCTHLGCTVPCAVDGVMLCPCHGSQFDRNGDVISGPALTGLAHYLVTFECAGNDIRIFVDKTQILEDRQTRVLPA